MNDEAFKNLALIPQLDPCWSGLANIFRNWNFNICTFSHKGTSKNGNIYSLNNCHKTYLDNYNDIIIIPLFAKSMRSPDLEPVGLDIVKWLRLEVNNYCFTRDYAAALAATVENRFLNLPSGKNTRRSSPDCCPIVFFSER